VFHQYVVEVDDRDAVQSRLSDAGIKTLIHYPVPVHRQPGYQRECNLPVTEEKVDRILSLPVHPFLDDSEVQAVGETVRQICG
jgi:UDP-2-acetamido-2-deoxy-ribo-hexuluronate aminotransferase